MSNRMPSLFVSHGNPMLALDEQNGKDYRTWGEQLPKPKAILVFSAHWEEEGLVFGETINHNQLVYDFFGFPEPLSQVQYPAPGAPSLMDQVNKLLNENIQQSQRGLDHGVWVPLLHMWPQADIPILQMSLPTSYSNEELLELGKTLAPLREQGIMIIGAGTLTHNLREGLSGKYSTPPNWVTEFDQWVANALLTSREDLVNWEQAPHAKINHPSKEHFLPLLITADASSPEDNITFPITGYDMQVFSKLSVQFSYLD